ncbi:M23 family metallopeptidase [Flammeovirgaceae bacterium SG7u.111]|nr:M23 family metallopeptidase [Flammeovirgaceae bacterium SG7u.132]WPO34284.1 M23 family metallopeptidase [Flammeovirgaceae bacterium SG7u.111]
MKQRKTISNRLTSRLLLIVRDEENFAEKTTIKFSYAKLILSVSIFFLVMLGLSFALATTVLSKWFDPRTESLKTSSALLEIEDKLDSLIIEVDMKDRYIQNLKMVLEGGIPITELQTSETIDSFKPNQYSNNEIHPIDSQFRKEFEEDDYEQLSLINSTRHELQEFFFFMPISNGVVSKEFSVKEGHYGLDIVAKKNESIKAIADGTIIMSSWTQDAGYVIAIQHKHQLISVYKHNSVLLGTVGKTVKAGDIIAIIGNTGEYTDGPHLHLEIWFNGNPVNPQDFIPL